MKKKLLILALLLFGFLPMLQNNQIKFFGMQTVFAQIGNDDCDPGEEFDSNCDECVPVGTPPCNSDGTSFCAGQDYFGNSICSFIYDCDTYEIVSFVNCVTVGGDDGGGDTGGDDGGGGGGGGDDDPDLDLCDLMGGYLDNCGNCVTIYYEECDYEEDPPVPATDCAGVVGGTAYFDQECNCVGGNTGLFPNNQPTKGNPIRNTEIAPTGAGLRGGRNGLTRKYANGNAKYHDGTDIAAVPGSFLHPLYSGTVVGEVHSVPAGTYGNAGDYGNYILIRSTLPDGSTIYVKYNHLDGVDVVQNQFVNWYDVIGTTGKTGNAYKSNIIAHVHIQVRPSNDFGKGSYKHYTPDEINPEDHITTKFDQDGNPIESEPCN